MSPRDTRTAHRMRLQRFAEAEGFGPKTRVFRSAEGELSPLTISESTELAQSIGKVSKGSRKAP